MRIIRAFMIACLLFDSAVLLAKSSGQLMPCFDAREAEQVSRQFNNLLQQEFCEEKVNPNHFAYLSKSLLQGIMTQSFLGVNPPENWQLLLNDVIKQCVENQNLCKKEAQTAFEQCLKLYIPLLFVQFAPWLAEHCNQLNESLIKQWPKKQPLLKKIIEDAKDLKY